MNKAFLIYNPASGRKQERRLERISRAAEVLHAAGVQAEIHPTTGKGSAIQQTQAAISQGFDTLIACGGDGTVNEVLNGLMLAEAGTRVALGVIPLGSANLMATDIHLPRDPESAARRLLTYQPRELHPGLISYSTKAGPQQRWFVGAAGVGADAELMYRTAKGPKQRYGIYAYFAEMARMAWRRRFPMFLAEWDAAGDGRRYRDHVALVLAVRARRFPGLMRRVSLGSDLTSNQYRLLLFRTDKLFPFLNSFFSVISGWNWKVAEVEVVSSRWFRCVRLDGNQATSIYCEADGENLGKLPVEVSIDSKTFRLLMPEQATSK